jgi:hypothetical protein
VEKTIDTHAGRLAYSDTGEGPVVLLLHATLHDRHDFGAIVPVVRRLARCCWRAEPASVQQRADHDPTTRRHPLLYGGWLHREHVPDFGPICKKCVPSPGARHTIEIYLVINRCHDTKPGVYHYCVEHHRLVRVSDRDPQQLADAALLQQAYSLPIDMHPGAADVEIQDASRVPKRAS